VLILYDIFLAVAQRQQPDRLARAAHAALREDWFIAISQQKGSEIVAVQTLRNSLMSATMIASTALLGLIGTVTVAAPSLRQDFGASGTGLPIATPRLMLELVLIVLLFASLIASAMAVRYFNHASFIGAMPIGSPVREQWSGIGAVYVRRAGLLYSWSLRHLIMVAPILACILYPLAGPVAALIVVAVLFTFDRFGAG